MALKREIDFERGYDKALAEGAEAVSAMDERLRDAERMLLAVILSCGGKVEVTHRALVQCFDADWRQMSNAETGGITLEAKVRSKGSE